jgi:hypothetical protein
MSDIVTDLISERKIPGLDELQMEALLHHLFIASRKWRSAAHALPEPMHIEPSALERNTMTRFDSRCCGAFNQIVDHA